MVLINCAVDPPSRHSAASKRIFFGAGPNPTLFLLLLFLFDVKRIPLGLGHSSGMKVTRLNHRVELVLYLNFYSKYYFWSGHGRVTL